MGTQAKKAIATLEEAGALGRGEWGALSEALNSVTVVNRDQSVGPGRPTVIVYRLSDGTTIWRHANEAILHTEAVAKAA